LNKKWGFLILVLVSGVAIVLVNFLVLLFFRSASVLPVQLAVRIGIPGVFFIGIYNLLIGRQVGLLDANFFQNASGDIYTERLKKIGSIPIKSISLVVLLQLLFLGGLFFRNEYLGIQAEIKGYLFFAALSLGMLTGTFVYVLSDNIVSRTLIGHNLALFPRDLREERQGLKLLIIPLAVTLVSLFFSFSLIILMIDKSGGTLAGLTGGSWVQILLIMAVFFIIVFILAFTLRKNTKVLFDSIIAQLENLSSEQKDLTKRISICSVDELGTISGMVNSFCENMGGGLKQVMAGQGELSASGLDLEKNASGIAASISQVSGGVEQVRRKAQSQMRSVTDTSAVIQQIAKNIEALNNSIAMQASSVSEASAAVEEMVGNIGSIGNTVDRMANQFKTVNKAASEGTAIQRESRVKVQEIVDESKALQDANKIIAVIASQTNLLAMNAAIEAAHAGDAGRGFSVVADEIRKLAENSSRESHKISTELKQISATIDSIVKGAKSSEDAFIQVSERVGETERLVSEVDNAIREQREGADQVLIALKSMNDITAEVSTGSKEMQAGNVSMLAEMDRLQTDSREISDNMDEMVKSVSQINSGAQEVSSLAESTQASIRTISVIVDSFKV
jgi:methyl-accepting chemotaxis protein